MSSDSRLYFAEKAGLTFMASETATAFLSWQVVYIFTIYLSRHRHIKAAYTVLSKYVHCPSGAFSSSGSQLIISLLAVQSMVAGIPRNKGV